MITQATVDMVVQSSPFVGFLTPLLVAFVTRNALDSRLKALLAGVFAVGAALYNHNGTIDQETLKEALTSLAYAVSLYKGIWEHVDVNGKMFPRFGVGPKSSEPELGDPDFDGDEGFEGA